MRASQISWKMMAAGLMLGGLLFAQAPSSSRPAPKKPAGTASQPKKGATAPKLPAWRQECSKQGGFCIEVPKDWKSEGTVFDGTGFVVAEPNKEKQEADWNQITAAATEMPESEDGKERPSTDELIDIILGSPINGIQTQTMQRSKRTIAGMPTEILKVRLRAADASTDAIEYIALMDDGETIYSVALGCAPEDATRLEPLFERALHSWKATTPIVPESKPSTPPPTNPE